MHQEKKQLSKNKLFLKLCSYCAYQERCFSEIELLINKYEISEEDKNELLGDLIAQKFIDELRYAKSVARGKFNFKAWGKIKIRFHLRGKGISDSHIQKAFLEIDKKAYLDKCEMLIAKKKSDLAHKELDEFTLKQKLIAYMSQKGFEFDVIREFVD
jgi:regulatory protein